MNEKWLRKMILMGKVNGYMLAYLDYLEYCNKNKIQLSYEVRAMFNAGIAKLKKESAEEEMKLKLSSIYGRMAVPDSVNEGQDEEPAEIDTDLGYDAFLGQITDEV